jgi:hypothetical protein
VDAHRTGNRHRSPSLTERALFDPPHLKQNRGHNYKYSCDRVCNDRCFSLHIDWSGVDQDLDAGRDRRQIEHEHRSEPFVETFHSGRPAVEGAVQTRRCRAVAPNLRDDSTGWIELRVAAEHRVRDQDSYGGDCAYRAVAPVLRRTVYR